jgi:hypothetical protein
VDANGSNATAVTQLRGQLGSPRWSPDSNRIVFDSVTGEGRALFIVDASGGAPRRRSAWGNPSRASWSPDGRWIYFGDKNAKGGADIWKVSTTDSTRREQVTHDGGFEAYESSDGKILYYAADGAIQQMPVAGGPSSVVNIGLNVSHGWWGVAGGGIYFVDVLSPQTHTISGILKGPKAVYFFDPQSGNRRQVASIAGDLVPVTPDFCVSSDGSAIYYSLLEVSVSQIRMIEWQ